MLFRSPNLRYALRGAGPSYGIVTEFLYKVYNHPETYSCVLLIYIENGSVKRLDSKTFSGKKQVFCLFRAAQRPAVTFHFKISPSKKRPQIKNTKFSRQKKQICLFVEGRTELIGLHFNVLPSF